MGASSSIFVNLIDKNTSLLRETAEFAKWTINDVKQLYVRYRKTFGMALTELELENLLLFKKPTQVTIKELFKSLDTNNDGRIDSFEFFTALICICEGSFEEKTKFAFELFDFNKNGSLSLTELALLLKSLRMGLSLFTCWQKELFQYSTTKKYVVQNENQAKHDIDYQKWAQDSFSTFDKELSNTLNFEEFLEWTRSNREFMIHIEQLRILAEHVNIDGNCSLPTESEIDSDLDEEDEFYNLDLKSTCVSDCGISNTIRRRFARGNKKHQNPKQKHWNNQSYDTKYDIPPQANIELEWIYGTNGRKDRNSIRYLVNGDIVYIVSKYAIVYSPLKHSQRTYHRHERIISCLDVNSVGDIIATAEGQCRGNMPYAPEIHIWNGLTLVCLAILSNFHKVGISHVSFPHIFEDTVIGPASSDTHRKEQLLISIGQDEKISVAMWNWTNQCLVASTSSDVSILRRVLTAAFCPRGIEFFVGGVNVMYFQQFQVHGGRFSAPLKPYHLEKALNCMPTCVSAVYMDLHTIVIGTSSGSILQLHKHIVVRMVQAHDIAQSINVCFLSRQRMVLITAGKDGKIKQWDKTLRPIGAVLDIHEVIHRNTGGNSNDSHATILNDDDFRLSSVAYNEARKSFVLGTRFGNIFEVMEGINCIEKPANWQIIAIGHKGRGNLLLAVSRCRIIFATCNLVEKCVKLWNMRRRKLTAKKQLYFTPSAMCFNTKGDWLMIGGESGDLNILGNLDTISEPNSLFHAKNASAKINLIRFDCGDRMVAVACSNGYIYMYLVENYGTKKLRLGRYMLLIDPNQLPGYTYNTILKHGELVSIDFTTDSRHLRYQCRKHRSLVWDLTIRQSNPINISSAKLSTLSWDTQTTILHNLVQRQSGILYTAGDDQHNIIFSIDVNGSIILSHYPLYLTTHSGFKKEYRNVLWLDKRVTNAHFTYPKKSQCSPKAAFTLHDSLVLSSTGCDGVVCQWRITRNLNDIQYRLPAIYNNVLAKHLRAIGRADNVYYDIPYYLSSIHSEQIKAVKNATHKFNAWPNINFTYPTQPPAPEFSIAYLQSMNIKRCMNQPVCVAAEGKILVGIGTAVVVYDGINDLKQKVFMPGLSESIAIVVAHQQIGLKFVAVGSCNRLILWDIEENLMLATIDQNLIKERDSTIFENMNNPTLQLHSVAFDSSSAGFESSSLMSIIWRSVETNLHILTFYDWKQHKLLTVSGMTTLPVLFGTFLPKSRCPSSSDQEICDLTVSFISGGVGHTTFWRLQPSMKLTTSAQGVFGLHAVIETMTCGVAVDNFFLTGTASGRIVVWDREAVAAHSFSLNNLFFRYIDTEKPSPYTYRQVPVDAIVSIVNFSCKRCIIVGMQSGHIAILHYKENTTASSLFTKSFEISNDSVNSRRISQFGYDKLREFTLSYPERETTFSELNTFPVVKLFKKIDDSNLVLESNIGRQLEELLLLDECGKLLAICSTGEIVLADTHQLLQCTDPSTLPDSQNQDDLIMDIVASRRIEVVDIAMHPQDSYLCTVSSDRIVSVWSLKDNKIIQTKEFDVESKSVAWRGSGEHIAISNSDGMIQVVSATTLNSITSFMCGPLVNTTTVQNNLSAYLIKYSSQNEQMNLLSDILVCCCRDHKIYVYSVADNENSNAILSSVESVSSSYILKYTFEGHRHPIKSVDFSLDGQWLQSTGSPSDEEVLRWRMSNDDGKMVAKMDFSQLADQWETWTSTLVKSSFGLSIQYGIHVTALNRVPNKLWHEPSSRHRGLTSYSPCIVGTDDGQLLQCWLPISLSSGPTMLNQNLLGVHCKQSIISHILYSYCHSFMVACSQNEYGETLFSVWKVCPLEEVNKAFTNVNQQEIKIPSRLIEEMYYNVPYFVNEFPLNRKLHIVTSNQNKAIQVRDGIYNSQAYLQSSKDHTCNKMDESLPSAEMRLKFVYGMNIKVGAMYTNDPTEILYSSSSYAIVYNTKTQKQRISHIYDGGSITSLAIHPNGVIFATGTALHNEQTPYSKIFTKEQQPLPKIVLWDTCSGEKIAESTTNTVYGVRLLSFVPKNNFMVSIGADMDHTLAIYGFKRLSSRLYLINQLKTSKNNVWSMAIHPTNGEIVTSGEQHIIFWKQDILTFGNQSITGIPGDLCSHPLCKVSVSFKALIYVQNDNYISGQNDGSIYLWKSYKCMNAKQRCHEGPVSALDFQTNTQSILSAGCDGNVRVWNLQLEFLQQFDINNFGLQAQCQLLDSSIMRLSTCDNHLLITTAGGEVCELRISKQINKNGNPAYINQEVDYLAMRVHLRSHLSGFIYALDSHPLKYQFVTGATDGTLRLWDAPTQACTAIWTDWLKCGRWCQAVAFSIDGHHIAVGSNDGCIAILSESLDSVLLDWMVFRVKKGIKSICYAPGGRLLLIAAENHVVYIYHAQNYTKLGECIGHTSAITSFKFSTDGKILQTIANATHEEKFWQTNDLQQLLNFNKRNTISWNTIPYKPGMPSDDLCVLPTYDKIDPTIVSTATLTNFKDIVLISDSNGLIRMYNYPLTHSTQGFKIVHQNATPQHMSIFIVNNLYYITVDSENAICQFKYTSGRQM